MKIKCVKTENGTIIPIHQIAYIAPPDGCHYIRTSADTDRHEQAHLLSHEQYNKLLNELEML